MARWVGQPYYCRPERAYHSQDTDTDPRNADPFTPAQRHVFVYCAPDQITQASTFCTGSSAP